ncbi:Eukaryotic translation initiation factor 4G [Morus notabilis]|uniref:Eukaryotic translation initiation factor 4G n=1 Tax=Morus notabilis TaxID=981085 RepID=W9QU10_9ROSA|nr:Eukaryotic translation initiation factor 4G [Morus notabilis]
MKNCTTYGEVPISKSEKLHQQSAPSLAVDASKHEVESVGGVGGGGSTENLGGSGVSVPPVSKEKPQFKEYRCKREEEKKRISSEAQQSAPSLAVDASKHEVESVGGVGGGGSTENLGGSGVSVPPVSKEKPFPELSRSKSTAARGKKKRKEYLQKADAAGTTSDLYMAYKGPGEKKETTVASEVTESTFSNIKVPPDEAVEEDAVVEKDAGVKAEPDDWEDAADISKPKLEASDEEQDHGGVMFSEKDGNGNSVKKYSRDFLLKFAEQFTVVPEEITADVAEVLMSPNANASHVVDRNSFQTPGRIIDRPGGGPRLDRRNSGMMEHKGLIPSPQTMHKTENEVGKVADEEEAKQRQLKRILNKLTPQNFERLFERVKAVKIDNAGTLRGVTAQIFDKALMEPTFCEMYANICYHLSGELPGFNEENEKITFKRLLINKCQEEFERGEREQEEAYKADEVKQSQVEREEKGMEARRRMLGNIRLIGELYKKKMLTERIMHECIQKLLAAQGQHQTPDEEDVEALCILMSTIGEIIDHPIAKEHMDAYFEGMKNLSNNMNLSSRVRFMLKDAIDLRKNKWQQRRKVEEPKKIEKKLKKKKKQENLG